MIYLKAAMVVVIVLLLYLIGPFALEVICYIRGHRIRDDSEGGWVKFTCTRCGERWAGWLG